MIEVGEGMRSPGRRGRRERISQRAEAAWRRQRVIEEAGRASVGAEECPESHHLRAKRGVGRKPWREGPCSAQGRGWKSSGGLDSSSALWPWLSHWASLSIRVLC